MVKSISLHDTTFIIPVRIDSLIRLENLLAVIRFLRTIHCRIIIIESVTSPLNVTKRFLPKDRNICYMPIIDNNVIYYRTHYINVALESVTTPYVAVWDADVVVSISQINDSIETLRKGECDVSFPYDGTFLNTDYIFRSDYLVNHDIGKLTRYKSYFNKLYGKNFVGGGFIINKDKYILAGKENENFYGWGPEDLDRVQRWEAMGYKIHRSKGPMFHLCHPRDINGNMRSKIHHDLCMEQLQKSKYASHDNIILTKK